MNFKIGELISVKNCDKIKITGTIIRKGFVDGTYKIFLPSESNFVILHHKDVSKF